jgi:hypothetical protein
MRPPGRPTGECRSAQHDDAPVSVVLDDRRPAKEKLPVDLAKLSKRLHRLAGQAITGTTLLVDGGQHLSRQPRDVAFAAAAPEA